MHFEDLLGANLRDEFVNGLAGIVLRARCLDSKAVALVGDIKVGTELAVDVFDEIGDGSRKLVAGPDVLGIENDKLAVSTGLAYSVGLGNSRGNSNTGVGGGARHRFHGLRSQRKVVISISFIFAIRGKVNRTF